MSIHNLFNLTIMLRKVLIALIIILILVISGVYFIVINPKLGKSVIQNIAPGKSFDVQGVKVEVLKQGSGVESKKGEAVTLHYVGMLAADGKKFDSSIERNAPFTFVVGEDRVIKGFDLGILGMKVGEKRKLTIPPELAYGSTAFLEIPANSTLIYEVELLQINPSQINP